jgi:hypothetical protein
MAFQSAFVTTVTQDNFGIFRSKTDEVCYNGLHVRILKDLNSDLELFALSVIKDFYWQGRDLSHINLHNPTLIPQNKPRNFILRPALHLHPKTVIPRL